MAEIVSAVATSHVLFDPAANPERAKRVVDGMQKLGKRTAESKPDVILMITSDHMFNIDLDLQPPFCIGVSDEYLPLGEMGIPRKVFPGHRDFALSIAEHSQDYGFDIALAESLQPDHGVTIPLLCIRPWGQIPLVPLYVNINMTPVPSPERCHNLALALREIIRRHRPAAERVAVIGSGGLSHWLSIPGMGKVHEEWDADIMNRITSGNGASIAKFSSAEILEQGGNGGLEILNWMMMSIISRAARGEKIFYEPMSEWMTGMGGVAMYHN